MVKTIELKDKRVETLLDIDDFEFLIDQYMGFDAVKVFREMICNFKDEYDEKIECLMEQIEILESNVDELKGDVDE